MHNPLNGSTLFFFFFGAEREESWGQGEGGGRSECGTTIFLTLFLPSSFWPDIALSFFFFLRKGEKKKKLPYPPPQYVCLCMWIFIWKVICEYFFFFFVIKKNEQHHFLPVLLPLNTSSDFWLYPVLLCLSLPNKSWRKDKRSVLRFHHLGGWGLTISLSKWVCVVFFS